MLLAGAGSAFAQAKPASADPAGGAYYEFMMGLHLESQGDSAGATAAYQRAERLDPASAEIPAALAELYARMNRPADAIAAGERAVKANPSNPEANWILGSLYARMSEMPNTRAGRSPQLLAARDRESRAGEPQRASRRAVMLGRLYLADGQLDKAVALLAPFVNEQPDQIEAVALLAEAYQATDREADAVALLERSVEDSPEFYGTLAQVYEVGPLARRRPRIRGRRAGAAAEPAAAGAVGHRAA